MPGKAGYEIGTQVGDDRNIGSPSILKYPNGPLSENRTGNVSSVTAYENFAMCIPPGTRWLGIISHRPGILGCPESISSGLDDQISAR